MASAVVPAYLLAREILATAVVVRRRRAHRRHAVDRADRLPDERGRRVSGVPVGDPRVPADARRAECAARPARRRPARRRDRRANAVRGARARAATRDPRARGGGARDGRPRERLVAGARAALGRHRALWWSYAVGAVAAVVVVLAGYRLFGAYSTTVEGGSILPAGVWWSSVEHLVVVGIGSGLVPLVLGARLDASTSLSTPILPPRAFATLSLLAIAALALQTASFDLRFGGEDIIRDRYLFYVRPSSAGRLGGGARRGSARQASRSGWPRSRRRRGRSLGTALPDVPRHLGGLPREHPQRRPDRALRIARYGGVRGAHGRRGRRRARREPLRRPARARSQS